MYLYFFFLRNLHKPINLIYLGFIYNKYNPTNPNCYITERDVLLAELLNSWPERRLDLMLSCKCLRWPSRRTKGEGQLIKDERKGLSVEDSLNS